MAIAAAAFHASTLHFTQVGMVTVHVSTLADQIGNHPLLLALLD
jgi:hypothetical protein